MLKGSLVWTFRKVYHFELIKEANHLFLSVMLIKIPKISESPFTRSDRKSEVKIQMIGQMEFDHKANNPPRVRMAIVYPNGAKPFETPADSLRLQTVTIGMGLSHSWYEGLPLTGGNLVPFKKIKRVDIHQGNITGPDGNKSNSVKVVLLDDECLQGRSTNSIYG